MLTTDNSPENLLPNRCHFEGFHHHPSTLIQRSCESTPLQMISSFPIPVPENQFATIHSEMQLREPSETSRLQREHSSPRYLLEMCENVCFRCIGIIDCKPDVAITIFCSKRRKDRHYYKECSFHSSPQLFQGDLNVLPLFHLRFQNCVQLVNLFLG